MKSYNYLVLIRGINVGGKNTIKMDELKQIFLDMKFTDVETYIQSGNVLFRDCEKNKKKLVERIEEALSKKLKNDIKVAILTISELKEVINDIPKDFGEDIKSYKYDVIFLIEPLTPKEVINKIKIKQGKDIIFEGSKSLYVKRFIEKLTGSYIAEILKISQNITVRNLNTTKRLYELMLEREKSME